MSSLALTLGPLALDGGGVRRSELRWRCPPGHVCRAGEIVATCTLGLDGGDAAPFADERAGLKVALASPVAGRITPADATSRGGLLAWLPSAPWEPETVWAHIGGDDSGPAQAVLTFHAIRPVAELAGGTTFDGWRDRARGWSEAWCEKGGVTLLGAGICEQEAILRGYGVPFADMLAAAPHLHVVQAQEEPLVPSAGILLEASARTPEMRLAIRQDIARSFADLSPTPTATEWMFAAALMNALERSPLDDGFDILTRAGVAHSRRPDALCLSLHAELPRTARHKRLGYTINAHGFRLARAGPAVGRWLREAFEPVHQTVDDVATDLRAMATALEDRPLLIVNMVSTQAFEHLRSYRGLDDATLRNMGTVRAKELNLLLHDLARERGLRIVDADAIVAELGMARHLPDGIHGTEALYAEIRAELLHQLGTVS